MSVTDSQARDIICGVIQTAWSASETTNDYSLLFEDTGEPRPTSAITPWGWVSVRSVDGFPATLTGDRGTRRFTSKGLAVVEIFTPPGKGRTLAQAMAGVIRNALSGPTSLGVHFRRVRIKDGATSGSWTVAKVVADYEYDEIR